MNKFSVIILTILCLTLSIVPSVYADDVQEISYTFTSSNVDVYSNVMCGQNTNIDCSPYHYISLTLNNGSDVNYAPSVRFTYATATDGFMTFSGKTPVSYYDLPSSFDYLTVTWVTNGNFFSQFPNATLTVTLMDDLPSIPCPDCPEPQDPNRSPVMDDFHNVFINTMLSIIPITAIIFVVWFFIDLLSSLVFGRGK